MPQPSPRQTETFSTVLNWQRLSDDRSEAGSLFQSRVVKFMIDRLIDFADFPNTTILGY